ncbi:glycosyltransferase family 39 protein [Hyphobacterium sp. CCMP332]|nr:glycosyltransferase family 39 protein [Hyphobacterium sp. CCMP332]
MSIVLFFIALISVFLILKSRNTNEYPVLESILIVSLSLYLGSELLSAIHFINKTSIKLLWLCIDIFLLVLIFKNKYWKDLKIKVNFPKSAFPYLVIVWIILLYSVTLIIVAYTPPYNWDSMTYHLPRIFQWIQNDSLNHFATTNTRQIYMTPYAEYVGMHFYLLSGDDFGFNLVQWLFSIGFLIAVFRITKIYSPKGNAKWLAVLFSATMPMLILQTSSTQNDLVAAFFLICSFYFLEKFRVNYSISSSIFLGLSIGFAVLTKGTNYIFLIPFAIYLAYTMIKKWKEEIPNKQFFIIIGLIVFLNIGYWARNYLVFDSPFGGKGFFVEKPSISTVFSGVVKNSSQNLMLTENYLNLKIERFEKFNYQLRHFVYDIHEAFNWKADNPNKSWQNTFWWQSKYHHSNSSEDFQSNPLHITIIIMMILLLFHPKIDKTNEIWTLLAITISAYLLFSILLKWQPWHNRQLMGLIALAGIAFSLMFSKSKYLIWGIGLSLIIFSINPLIDHGKRSLLPNDDRYIFSLTEKEMLFVPKKELLNDFLEMEKIIRKTNPKFIGLELKFDDWEYPFWYYLWDEKKKFNQISVKYESAKLMREFEPNIIFSSYNLKNAIIYNENEYHLILHNKLGKLYSKE